MFIQRKDMTRYALVLACLLPFVQSSMAPSGIKAGKKEKRNYDFSKDILQKYQNIYQGKAFARDVAKQHTSSDAMELYSVAAKKVLRVKERKDRPSYDAQYDLVVTNKKGSKQNKFVTETISFQNLRIKSQDNDLYLCVKNTDVTFLVDKYRAPDIKSSTRTSMSKVTNKQNKPRKRCQFTWDFTDQMHIQLSTKSKSTKLYLAVKDGNVVLTEKHESTELERSFIWVPTKSAGSDITTIDNNNKNKRHLPSIPNARSFEDMESSADVCSGLMREVFKKANKISNLKTEINELKKKMQESKSKLK